MFLCHEEKYVEVLKQRMQLRLWKLTGRATKPEDNLIYIMKNACCMLHAATLQAVCLSKSLKATTLAIGSLAIP